MSVDIVIVVTVIAVVITIAFVLWMEGKIK